MIKIKVVKGFNLKEISIMYSGTWQIGGIGEFEIRYISTQSDRMWFKYRLRQGD